MFPPPSFPRQFEPPLFYARPPSPSPCNAFIINPPICHETEQQQNRCSLCIFFHLICGKVWPAVLSVSSQGVLCARPGGGARFIMDEKLREGPCETWSAARFFLKKVFPGSLNTREVFSHFSDISLTLLLQKNMPKGHAVSLRLMYTLYDCIYVSL